MTDLERIKELEKEIGQELKEMDYEKIMEEDEENEGGYALDEHNNMVGLNLDAASGGFPKSLSLFRHLKKLRMHANFVTDVSGLAGLVNLSELDLGYNILSSLSGLEGLTNLTWLSLDGNKLDSLSGLEGLINLTWLCLDSNKLGSLSGLEGLVNLRHLSLYNNKLSSLSGLRFKELKNLKSLNLHDNEITYIPAEILDLGLEIKWEEEQYGEEGIYLVGNPLESPPVEIIKQGNEAIRQYFKSLDGKQQALKQRLSGKPDRELFFICYSKKDEEFVLHLCKKLKEVGVKIWLDQWDIAPGDDRNKSIDDALYKCTRMLIILSPDAVGSDEVYGELYTFFDSKKPVFPIVYRSCRIPRRLNVIQYMNLTSSDLGNKTKIAKLVELMTK